MPPSRRYLVSLLSMWQPVGVVVASAIAYGTAAKYRCETTLPSCSAVGDSEACCSISSNMGWRYMVIIIGTMTLFIFFARYLIFRFHESPKFLVSKGREQDAIDVLHKIAKFNGAPAPTLTMEDFYEIDRMMGVDRAEQAAASDAKNVVMRTFQELSFLRGLFLNKLGCFTFVLLGLAYMVCYNPIYPPRVLLHADHFRVTTGRSTWLAPSSPSFYSATTWMPVPAASKRPIASMCTSTFRVLLVLSLPSFRFSCP